MQVYDTVYNTFMQVYDTVYNTFMQVYGTVDNTFMPLFTSTAKSNFIFSSKKDLNACPTYSSYHII